MAASPHIAAGEEGIRIDLHTIKDQMQALQANGTNGARMIIEGAGGLMVPLNEKEFMADLIQQLQARVVLVSRNYLGSINHSLLTAEVCRQYKLDVLGWVFNDQYMSYEDEIVYWSGFPKIASVPVVQNPDARFIATQAALVKEELKKLL
jgi:dethiobiotin synthetase